jgi:uncharacterized protein
MKTLLDTGFLIGLFSPKDAHHKACTAFMAEYRGEMVTCWAAITETTHFLSHLQQGDLMKMLSQHVDAKLLRIENPPPEAVMALWQLMDKYEDLPMDFCDASLVYLATALKIDRIATVDRRDFTVYRLPSNKKFVHVLEPYQK